MAITHIIKENKWDSQSELTKKLIEDFKTILLTIKFHGTVHCEASLMG